jgi:glucose/arabinose dehydrogenase
LGDGGGANDTDEGHEPDWYNQNEGGNGQHLKNNLLGSILRIDVDKALPYAIPKDNPFPNEQGMKEVYAYGLRNPYRFTFDMGGNHSLIAGDAGQELYEEINLIEKGGNYGWNVKEGTHCFNASNNKQPLNSCPDKDSNGNPLIDPVIEFKNSNNLPDGLGIVVVGGHVYRGKAYPGLNSKYLFGVWTQHHEKPDGAIFVAQANEGVAQWNFKKLFMKNAVNGELGHFLLGFGQDRQGEIYLLTSDEHGPVGNTGKVFRVR